MNNIVIDIQNAVVAYREDVALQDVSLTVRRGEFIGIIGPNGAGKTTLLTVVNGLGRLVHGQARMLGMAPHRRDGYRLRRRIGYVAQAPDIDPRLPITVRETVMSGRSGRLGWFRTPRRDDWARVDAASEKVGISHLRRRPIGQLSGGEYQRVAIARALAQEPEIFLFDEPTASIDPQAQRDILDLMQRLHQENHTTTLYVTHDLATLPEICQRLVLMKAGRIWREGAAPDMLKKDILSALYNGNGLNHSPRN